jgi:hypothetical protein
LSELYQKVRRHSYHVCCVEMPSLQETYFLKEKSAYPELLLVSSPQTRGGGRSSTLAPGGGIAGSMRGIGGRLPLEGSTASKPLSGWLPLPVESPTRTVVTRTHFPLCPNGAKASTDEMLGALGCARTQAQVIHGWFSTILCLIFRVGSQCIGSLGLLPQFWGSLQLPVLTL